MFGRLDAEVFSRLRSGELRALDGDSDDALVLDRIRNHRPEMRFGLTYDGSLKAASQRDTRSAEKWSIRRQLSPQLEELWSVHPALQGIQLGYPAKVGTGSQLIIDTKSPQFGPASAKAKLREGIAVGEHIFLPLVRNELKLTCSLDILFLRKGEAGSVVNHGGDIDNRLKVLFDGLRMPNRDELALTKDPIKSPFYCLLEDDQMITSLAVRTDRLLTRVDAPSNQVRLIIDVIVSPTAMLISNSGFLAD